MTYLKIMKQLGAVCFLLGSVILLSGCLDSGLNLMARKNKNRMESTADSNVEINSEPDEETNDNSGTEPSEEIIADSESSEVDKLLEDQTAEKMVESFFKELGDFIEDVSKLMADKEKIANQEDEGKLNVENLEENKEEENEEKNNDLNRELQEQLEQTDNTDSAEEGLISCNQIDSNNCQANSVVCARVKAQTKNGEEIEWLEFENACQACQNSSQKIGDMTLEITGFKEGKCVLP